MPRSDGGFREHDTSSVQQHIIETIIIKKETEVKNLSNLDTRAARSSGVIQRPAVSQSRWSLLTPLPRPPYRELVKGSKKRRERRKTKSPEAKSKPTHSLREEKGGAMKRCRANADERKGEQLKRRLLQQTMPTQFYLRVNARRI